MSASAGLSAAKRRRGGVQAKQPTPGANGQSNNGNVSRDVDAPVDIRTLVLQHDFKLYQIEQALGHLMHQIDSVQQTHEKAETNKNNTAT